MSDMAFLTQALCPAGDGVYAVTTGSERKSNLQKILYQAPDIKVIDQWQRQLRRMNDDQPCLLAIPSDSGGGILRGANWGPLFLREALYEQILPKTIQDLGDVRVIPQLLLDEYITPRLTKRCRRALYGQEPPNWPVSPLSIARKACGILYQKLPKLRLLALGGDHSVSYPLIDAFLQAKKKQGIQVAVIHFDAHTDLLTERLGIPVNFATWVSHLLPKMEHRDCWIQLGIRASGQSQEHWQNTFGIQQFWAHDIRHQIMPDLEQQIINHLKKREIQEIYITFDIDALDSEIASATGTPEKHGLSVEFCTQLIEALGKHFAITAADLVEVAPLSHPNTAACNNNHTIDAACKILKSLLSNGLK